MGSWAGILLHSEPVYGILLFSPPRRCRPSTTTRSVAVRTSRYFCSLLASPLRHWAPPPVGTRRIRSRTQVVEIRFQDQGYWVTTDTTPRQGGSRRRHWRKPPRTSGRYLRLSIEGVRSSCRRLCLSDFAILTVNSGFPWTNNPEKGNIKYYETAIELNRLYKLYVIEIFSTNVLPRASELFNSE